MKINQTILGANGEIPIKMLSMEVTKAHETVHLIDAFLSLASLPRPMNSNNNPSKPMLLNQRKPVYRPLRMREPGVLVNQPLTSLIQKSDTLTKSRKQLQRHLRPPYHGMLVTLIKHPTATNSMAIPFPNVSALKQALRYYSTPSPRTSLGIQTRMPLTDKYWSA